ncbi:MAG TPA: hypothetical protein V6C57_06690, partial [Coleofasciculaceae cyanobacterium]
MMFRQGRQILIGVFLALLGLLIVLSLSVLSAEPSESATGAMPLTASASPPASLLQQGTDFYQSEQFSAAIPLWQQALTTFEQQGDTLNQAFVWSNLSLAYQQLGQWQAAAAAIATSLNLLQQADPTPQRTEILAKAFNTQGRLQWFQGELSDALATWQKATVLYEQMGDRTGVAISLINQAKALQALGFSVQAEAVLETIDPLLKQQSDPNLQATGLRSLGHALQRIGQLNESLNVLQESLAIAEAANLSTARSATLLDLGNTERALASRAIAIGKTDAAQQHTEAAIRFYQQAASTADLPLAKLQAQLNLLSLFVETQPTAAAQLVPLLQPELATLPLGRAAIYAQLNFAKSVIKLTMAKAAGLSEPNPATVTQSVAQLLLSAIEHSRNLQDTAAESYALGQLGELYELTGQWQQAQTLT